MKLPDLVRGRWEVLAAIVLASLPHPCPSSVEKGIAMLDAYLAKDRGSSTAVFTPLHFTRFAAEWAQENCNASPPSVV